MPVILFEKFLENTGWYFCFGKSWKPVENHGNRAPNCVVYICEWLWQIFIAAMHKAKMFETCVSVVSTIQKSTFFSKFPVLPDGGNSVFNTNDCTSWCFINCILCNTKNEKLHMYLLISPLIKIGLESKYLKPTLKVKCCNDGKTSNICRASEMQKNPFLHKQINSHTCRSHQSVFSHISQHLDIHGRLVPRILLKVNTC